MSPLFTASQRSSSNVMSEVRDNGHEAEVAVERPKDNAADDIKEGLGLSLSDFISTLDRIQFIIRIDDRIRVRDEFQVDCSPGQFDILTLENIPKSFKVYHAGDGHSPYISFQWDGLVNFDDLESFLLNSRKVFMEHVIKKGGFVFLFTEKY